MNIDKCIRSSQCLRPEILEYFMCSRSRILLGTVSVRFDSEREDSLSLRLTTYEISSD